ncbi:type IX secretion system protein PorQ [Chitinophaga rhizosphaerae]|uniref:type IX secretion system protein PorQ n=1 Tax=Chitinophaga rhizosphaerae TaxID=1864947 RepID=UPI0013DFBA5B|nr:type IX secretion system protein PorQ [Chitinophaga rhizosphaerae]
MKIRFLLIWLFLPFAAAAQLLGGRSSYAFLELPPSPQITALGGANVAILGNDVSTALLNPALLRPEMGGQLQVNMAGYNGGIKYGHAAFGAYAPGIRTSFAASLQYVGYGQMQHTDVTGNVIGTFRPVDFSFQLTASRRYLEKWHYGLTLKYIRSEYFDYSSTGLAADVGITFTDSARGWQAGLVAMKMGTQFTKYVSDENATLPFDLQVGISKKLAHVPIQLSATIHHLHQFDIRYSGPDLRDDIRIGNGDTLRTKGSGIDNLFRHFVLAAQWNIGKYLEITGAYNHLRRRELSLPERRGMSGFSLGVGVVVKKFQLRYARSWYQRAVGFHHIGCSIPLQQWAGIGIFDGRAGR